MTSRHLLAYFVCWQWWVLCGICISFPLFPNGWCTPFPLFRACVRRWVITMFGSMLLTNDTALLTFLPLGWFVLSSTGQEKHAALLFILQNCAANLCGMITPFGNPQNLYLFSYYGLSAKMFFSAMLPPFILSTVLIHLCCLVFPKDQLSVPEAQATVNSRQAVIYGGLFCLAVAMVLRLVPYILGLTVIVLALWLLDRHALKPWTGDCWPPSPRSSPFPAILPGWNLSGYYSPAFCPMGPCWSPRLPARSSAMFLLPFLLSRFTQDARALLVGVNVGGGDAGGFSGKFITFREYTRRVLMVENSSFFFFLGSALHSWQFFWLPCSL